MNSLPVLFVPGMMLDGRMYAPQIEALADSHPIHLADISQQDSIEALARDVLTLAPEKFALVGLSMGGIVALEMYRQAPRRITHLGLLDTTPLADNPARQPVRSAQMEAVKRGELKRVLLAEIQERYLSVHNLAKEALIESVLSMGLDLGPLVFCRQSEALQRRRDSRDLLSSVRCPTLVLCGREDKLCSPSVHVEMAAAIRRADLAVIAEAGHLSTLEVPRAVIGALRQLLGR